MTASSLPAAESAANIRTIADLPFHVMGRFQKALFIGRCKGGAIEGMSNKEFFERIRDLSLGLGALGMGSGDRVAILSESRPEWLLTDLAVVTAGAVTVPVYPTLSAAQIRYILEDSGAKIVAVSTPLQLQKVQQIRHQVPDLAAVIVFDAPEPLPGSVLRLEDVIARGHARMVAEWGLGKEFQDRARAIGPEQLATIIYTSGTTGEPKGVMLSHGNLTANLHGGHAALEVTEEDTALSFLPLSHSFERMVSYVYLKAGVTVVFAESFETVGRDLALVRPTIVTGVPRAYEKMQARILEKGQSGSPAKAALFRWAIRQGKARAHAVLRGDSPGALTSMTAALADRLVFSKIRAGLGGRLKFVVSGSAPLAPDTAEFFQGIGIPVIEGYGLTETAPILTVNPPDAPRVGTVGRAIQDVELKIADDGEILARGPNVMSGYYNKPQATADVLRNGWFHTGDIGVLDAGGYLRITDRKKDLLVTSGGKKVAPQPIEATLKRNPLVGEVVLLGDRRKFISALIVPDFPALERRLKDLGRPPGERAELVSRPDVVQLYDEIVEALNKELAQFEQIKRFALLPSEFTIESGELTPTLKVKRKVVEQRWQDVIERLYKD